MPQPASYIRIVDVTTDLLFDALAEKVLQTPTKVSLDGYELMKMLRDHLDKECDDDDLPRKLGEFVLKALDDYIEDGNNHGIRYRMPVLPIYITAEA